MAASDLIQFKRGTSAALQTLIANKSGIDGCFYLTIDTANATGAVKDSSRLYVGRADGSIVPVNQGITIVDSTDKLVDGVAHGDLHAGDFAYVSGDNIFAIYDGARWVQINSVTDTYLDDLGLAVTDDSNGTVTITTTGTLNQRPAGRASDEMSDAFTLTGQNGVTVSHSNKAITISGDPYTMASTIPANNSATINLTHGNNQNAGAVTIASKNGDHVKIEGSAANSMTIDAAIPETLAVAPKASSGNGFDVTLTNSFGDDISDDIDPTITVGVDAAKKQTVHFVDGNAALDVYTKAEVDELKKTLNALTYKGTVGTGGSAATTIGGISSASVGDVFKYVGDETTLAAGKSATGAEVSVREGDLLIATGTEDPTTGKITTSTLKFDVVPSGDDIDTYYSGSNPTHGWAISKEKGAGDDLGGIIINAGTALSLGNDSVASGINTVTINHANVNANAITVSGPASDVTQQDGATAAFTAITGINVNQQGHVTSVTTKTLNIAAQNNADIKSVTDTVTAANNVATVTTNVQMSKNNGDDGAADKSGSFKLGSDNLTITRDATDASKIMANFVWGSF